MKRLITTLFLLGLPFWASAQRPDTTQVPAFFRGQITATNNGISLIPNFSLNRPAAFFDLSVGRGRLSFDPMFRFGLNGKPWTFVFWFRYKLFNHPKFTASVGGHPSFLFRDETLGTNGSSRQVTTVQRYFAWETTPTYHFNKKVGLGIYYLGAHGLTRDLTQYTHFVALRALFVGVPLGKHFNATVVPQVYYLQQDALAGTYWNAIVTLAKNDFPVAITTNLSQIIRSEIPSKSFLWNLGLVYNFNQVYHRVE
jgi:hypothetical protein